MRPLYLYVWTDVFSDYTNGIAFALARDSTHARRLITDEYVSKMGGDKADNKQLRDYWRKECMKSLAGKPERITKPQGFQLSGGS